MAHKTAFSAITNSLRTSHALAIAILGLSLTILSTLQVQVNIAVSGYVFWGMFFTLLSLIVFISTALFDLIEEFNNLIITRYHAGVFPRVSSVVSPLPGHEENHVKLVLEGQAEFSVPKDTTVSISHMDEHEEVIGYGYVAKTQTGNNGKIEIITSKAGIHSQLWDTIIANKSINLSKLIVSSCVDRKMFAIDYLESENATLTHLFTKSKGAQDTGDGVAL